jgi:hypothetical protein
MEKPITTGVKWPPATGRIPAENWKKPPAALPPQDALHFIKKPSRDGAEQAGGYTQHDAILNFHHFN